MAARNPDQERSDEELALLAAHSPESLEGRSAACTVLGRYVRTVYRWCYGYVRDEGVAEDLSQDILLRAYRRLNDFEGWGRFSAWLYVITRNHCLDAVRRQARRRSEGDGVDALSDSRPGPHAELEAREAEEGLLDVIARHLTAQEQEVLWLRCLEKMPVPEITRVLGITQASGARGVLQTARRKLRAALGERCPDLVEGDDD
jgi:RNA polymerase sigma-70 factor (ECF subfamily)